MLAAVRSCGFALLIAVSTAGPTASAASADDGPCGRGGRPLCTILRPDHPGPDLEGPRRSGLECIVLVGGLGSPTDHDDRFFAPVLGEIDADPRFRQYRFGVDGAGSFDTDGAISRNGEQLRSLIQQLSGECPAIHVLSHSMGGAVADRAFSMGDLARDGVVSYVALAGPHNGATSARAIRPAVEADPLFAVGLSAATRAFRLADPTTEAVRDLARLRAPRPVRDVEVVRLRLVTDAMVLRRDGADRRVDVREYLPASTSPLEGHGQIVHHGIVRQVVRTTIEDHRVPREGRSPAEVRAATLASVAIDEALADIDDAGRIGLLTAAFATRSAVGPLSTALSFTVPIE